MNNASREKVRSKARQRQGQGQEVEPDWCRGRDMGRKISQAGTRARARGTNSTSWRECITQHTPFSTI